MEKKTLLPVRLKSRGQGPCIGDDEQVLTASSGFTKTVVHATVESIIKSNEFKKKDQRIIATSVDSDLLEFDTYSEEVNSRFGRPVLQIIKEEGVEAYEEVENQRPTNAYLHASVYDMTVADAAEELDETPSMVIETDDDITSVGGGWNDPNLVAAAATIEGDTYENDLRAFKPDLDWVFENWTDLGGGRSYIRSYTEADDREEQLEELSVDKEGTIQKSVINQVERSYTVHTIKGIEEAVVSDESDRYVSNCGAGFEVTDGLLTLDIDIESLDSTFSCGNCI